MSEDGKVNSARASPEGALGAEEAPNAELPPGKVPPEGGPSATDAPAPLRRRAFTLRPPSRSVGDRVTIYVVRAVFFLIAAGVGIQGARAFRSLNPSTSVTAFHGILVACGLAVVLIVLEAVFQRSPVRTVAALTFGLLLGLALSKLFQPFVELITHAVAPELIPEQMNILLAFLNLLVTTILSYFGVALLLASKDEFKFIIPFVEFRKEIKSHTPLILDTSVFVDGRLEAILSTGIFSQRLEVPRFVLDELQKIADSPDRSLRERGRRGMDILHAIERERAVDFVEFPLQSGEEVDSGLLRLAAYSEGKLVTTDHNLTKRARVQGIPVLNINDVASALKPAFVPGEVLRVRLLRGGEEPGQAVGFRKDGTMVVVENAVHRIGEEVGVDITSAIQTNAGRMVFGRLKEDGRKASKGQS